MGVTTARKEHSITTLISVWIPTTSKTLQNKNSVEKIQRNKSKIFLKIITQEAHFKTEHTADKHIIRFCYSVFIGKA